MTNYLAKENVLLLLGASGSGKSSLIQAGLIPKLKDQWGSQLFNFTFVPDVDPFESFYTSLYTKYQSKAKLARTIKEDTLIQVVQALKSDAQWLIFIDQFEEVFTRTPKTERDIFIKSLIKLIENSDSSVKVIMTMRADFLDKLSPYPDLGKVHDSSSRMLTDMEDSDLRLAIAEPAARNGVIFEQGLIDTIIADFKQQAGSLPLLQYTLNLLWSKDDITDRVLNTKTYQELGGVTGALQQQANKIYDQFDETQRKLAKEIFLELIDLEGKEAVSRRADKSIFEQDERQGEVLEQLIINRLLVGGKNDATVEVAHEALIRSWKVLQDLIREKEEIIILRNRLYADTKSWQDAQKASSELWSGSKLARIVEFKKEQALPNLDALAIAFIEASVAERDRLQKAEVERQKRDKRTAQRIAVGSVGALIISSGLGLMAWQQTGKADLNQAESLGRAAMYLRLNKNADLDVFISAIKAGKILRAHNTTNPEVIKALQEALAHPIEQNRLIGHQGEVWSVALSRDGKTIVSGSADKTIKVWDLATGKELRTLNGHQDVVLSVALSSDGKTLFSGSWDKTIKVWDLATGKELRTLNGHQDVVLSVALSSDGQTLFSGSGDKTIKVWDLATGKELRTLNGHQDAVWSVALSSDGQTLVSSESLNKTIKVWNLATGKELRTLNGHQGAVSSVALSSDGQTLVSGSWDKTIKVWDLATGKELRTLNGHQGAVRSVALSSDGKTLVSGSDDGTIKVWDLATGKELRTLNGHQSAVRSVALSRDGKTLVSGSFDSTIKVWDLAAGKEPRTLNGHQDAVWSVALSSDGQTLVSGSDDGTIKVWDLATGKELHTLNGHQDVVYSVALSRDGKTLVSGSWDKTIKVWDLVTGKELRTLKGHQYAVLSVALSRDGKTLVSGSWDKTIKVWDLATGKELRTLKGHQYAVLSVALSRDGKTLVSGSDDSTIKVWDLATDKKLRTINGHQGAVRSVALSSDGQTLVSGSDDSTIKVWNLAAEKEPRTLNGHQGAVRSVALSSDGKTLVSGSGDKTIKVWDLATGKELRTISGHQDAVWSVALSSDGQTLVSGSDDNTIKVWDLDFDSLMARSCKWVRVYLQNPNSDVRDEDRHLCDGIGTQQ